MAYNNAQSKRYRGGDFPRKRNNSSNSGPRRNFGGNRGGGRPQNRIKYMQVDPQMLIKKAEPQEQQQYEAKHTFASIGLHPELAQNVARKGYEQPTPIQDQVIPHLLEGRDVIGLASTGTGKTAAFMLPILHKILQNPDEKAIIITPTRELALQVIEEGKSFAGRSNIYFTLLIGGVDIKKQIARLNRNPEIIVGTPGRIKDLTERRQLKLGAYKTIVLDEVDRMLDMGFINDISHIVNQLPVERHSLFFSATMPGKAKSVAERFLRDPITVQVATLSASNSVNQDIIRIQGRDKTQVLHELLQQPEFEKVIVFGRTKHGMEKLSNRLYKLGLKSLTIHGNKSQNQRQRALDAFKKNKVQVLLATDVAARGIDIDDISHVINYELPETYDDYIHRIGRTGRADKTGSALTFID